MPNATLCAKALVQMLLSQTPSPKPTSTLPFPFRQNTLTEIQTSLVTSGDLPQAYLISEERMERCGKLESVRVQDEKGIVGWGSRGGSGCGCGSLEGLVKAGRAGMEGGRD